MWTRFFDMHSGGDAKEQVSLIYIEAPQQEAEIVFYNRFGHDPNRITCSCCGEDYSIDEDETLEEATSYERKIWDISNKEYKTNMTVEEFINSGRCWVIYDKDIKPEERVGELPESGWVWCGY